MRNGQMNVLVVALYFSVYFINFLRLFQWR
jgi:hypothetical protein